MFAFLSRLFGGSSPRRLSARQFILERDPDAPVVDVRTPAEFAGGHIAGALNVNVGDPGFEKQIQRLQQRGRLDPDGPVYLYCRSGARSGRAARILVGMGFDQATNVGGFAALRGVGVATE